MNNKMQLLMVLVMLSLAALACCGTNCTPPQPSTWTAEPSQATPIATATQPQIIQTVTVDATMLATPIAATTQPDITQMVTVVATVLATPVPQENGLHSPLLLVVTNNGGSLYGDLWAWDAPGQPLRQLTNYGYNYNPVISPDGRYVAYDSIPRKYAPFESSGFPPANIWVLDITDGNAVRIADQPPDSNSEPWPYVHRPRVAWSPDSKVLVWGEHQGPETTNRLLYSLVRYDLEQSSQQIIVSDLPGYQGITDGQQVDWSPAGIADFVTPDNLLVIYDAKGTEVFRTQIDTKFDACPIDPAMTWARWVMDGSNPLIYLQDCSERSSQYLVDPATGKQVQNSGRLELYSLAAPGGLSLFTTQDGSGDVFWHVVSPEGASSDLALRNGGNPSALDMVAISPDGRQVVYLSDSGLMLYDGSGPSVPIDVPLKAGQVISWIGWGSTGWRIGHP